MRRGKPHQVQGIERRIGGDEQSRDNGEILRHVVGNREGRQRAAGHQQLLADADDLDQLRRARIEIHHIGGLTGGLRAGLHRHADIGLGKGRGIVGAVAAHGDQPAALLLAADIGELVFRRCLREEIVDAGLGGNRRRRHRIVAGDHHGADAHGAQLGKAFLDPGLHHVLEIDDAEQARAIGNSQRCAAATGNRIHGAAEFLRRLLFAQAGEAEHGIDRPFAQTPLALIHARKSGLGGELDHRIEAAFRHRNSEFTHRQRHDRAAFRRFIREAGDQRGLGQFGLRYARCGHEIACHTIAEGDGAGLVEQQRIDIARRFDRAAGGGDDIEAHEPIHAGDADGREQAADGRRDQCHQQGRQNGDRKHGAGITGKTPDRHADEEEDQRQTREQDRQRNLVRGLLPLSAFDQRDHPVDEARPRRNGDLHADFVGENLRAARHRRAVAAGFADDRGGFAGNRAFVDGGHPFDDLAIAGDQFTRGNEHDITDLEAGGRNGLRAAGGNPAGDEFGFGPLQAFRLRAAPAFGDGFRKGGEQHREPEPGRDLAGEDGFRRAGCEVAQEDQRDEGGPHFRHEDDGVAQQLAGIEFAHGILHRRQKDGRV